MKKVFACLSTILLMLVAFGLVMQPAKVSAVEVEDGKFIVDPTLEEGDIPMYCMNSIRTSFPKMYDYNALPDDNYGIGRDYYWNEIKLVVPLFKENAATGQQYTVYTVGSYNESKKTAAATKIYLWTLDENGKVVTATQTGSSVSWTGTYAPLFGDVSLSGVRYNVTGQDIPVQNIYRENGIVNGDHSTDCIYVLFNGEGKAVRGAAHDNYFAAENVAAYEYNLLFGYKDGKIVLRTDVAGGAAVNGFGAADADLDRVQLAVPNPDDPILDPVTGEQMYDEETGEPLYNTMYVDGEEANILTGQRYIWQWVSEEDFDAEEVNSVQYLEEGWLYTKWDYAFADPNGGYVLLAFAPSLSKFAALTEAQAACHNASVRALQAAGELNDDEAAALLLAETITVDAETGVETISYEYKERPVVIELTIPAGGMSYRYGYLDYAGNAVTEMHFGKYCKLWESALLFGRNADYQAYARTYNFTATGLEAKNAVYDNQSFIVREEDGKNIVEIKAGANIIPSQIIDINGMLGGFGVAGKPAKEAGSNVAAVQTYKNADVSELEYTMDIAEQPTMRPVVKAYEKLEDVQPGLLAALISWKASKGITISADTDWASFGNNTYGKFSDGDLDLFAEEVPEWAWFIEYYKESFAAQASADGFTAYTTAQANGARWGLYAFMNKIKTGSWPYSPDFTNFDYSGLVEASPEVNYRYNNWEEFVQAFLDAFNEYVYGMEQVPDATQWWDLTYTADAELQAKICAFFQTEDWLFVDELIDELCDEQGWTSYGKDHYYRYRCSMYAILNKTYRDSWPKSINCVGMEDPAWIGTILEKDWNKVEFSTEGFEDFDVIPLELTVVNNATGITDSLSIEFHVVKAFTPIIKIDSSALNYKAGDSLVLSNIVKAYDGVYKEGGSVYGSDISRQYLVIETPEGFDAANLAAGRFVLTATAKAPEETGICAVEQFVINVQDTAAPKAGLVSKEYHVQAGEEIDVYKLLAYAYDDVDGDYLRTAELSNIWYVIKTDYVPSESQVGEELDSQITIYDSTGNSTTLKFTTIVTGVSSVSGGSDDKPSDQTDTDSQSFSCGNAGILVAGVLAAAGLAVLVLRKKH